MMKIRDLKKSVKHLFFLTLVFLILGFALQKVFSINISKHLAPQDFTQIEKQLLLTESDGLLSENESRKILRSLDAPLAKTYVVGRSEWLEKVALDYGVPSVAIRSTNNLEDTSLRPGQTIIVQNKKGMFHLTKPGDSLDGIIGTYEKLGAKREQILASNNWDEIITIKEDGAVGLDEGNMIWIPNARRSFPFLFRPVIWSRISSRFGFRKHPILGVRKFHDGFDMVAPMGAPVYASDKGIVVYAGWMGGYGNMIEIQHSKIITRYGHLSKINVQIGQEVKRKQLIGRVGSTGLSTGAHLHFEVRRRGDGKLLNPRKYLF